MIPHKKTLFFPGRVCFIIQKYLELSYSSTQYFLYIQESSRTILDDKDSDTWILSILQIYIIITF